MSEGGMVLILIAYVAVGVGTLWGCAKTGLFADPGDYIIKGIAAFFIAALWPIVWFMAMLGFIGKGLTEASKR